MNLDKFVISLLFDDKETKKSADKIDQVVTSLSNSITKTLSAITFGFGVGFLKDAINDSIKLTTVIDNLSKKTLLSSQYIKAFNDVLKDFGGGATEGFEVLDKLSNLILTINQPNSPLNSVFKIAKNQGIDISKGNTTQGLTDILLQLYPKLGYQSSQKLNQLIGFSEPEHQFFLQGKNSFDQKISEKEKIGGITQQEIDKAKEARKAINDFTTALDKLKVELTVSLVPELTKTFNFITKFVSEISNKTLDKTATKITKNALDKTPLSENTKKQIEGGVGYATGLITAHPIISSFIGEQLAKQLILLAIRNPLSAAAIGIGAYEAYDYYNSKDNIGKQKPIDKIISTAKKKQHK